MKPIKFISFFVIIPFCILTLSFSPIMAAAAPALPFVGGVPGEFAFDPFSELIGDCIYDSIVNINPPKDEPSTGISPSLGLTPSSTQTSAALDSIKSSFLEWAKGTDGTKTVLDYFADGSLSLPYEIYDETTIHLAQATFDAFHDNIGYLTYNPDTYSYGFNSNVFSNIYEQTYVNFAANLGFTSSFSEDRELTLSRNSSTSYFPSLADSFNADDCHLGSLDLAVGSTAITYYVLPLYYLNGNFYRCKVLGNISDLIFDLSPSWCTHILFNFVNSVSNGFSYSYLYLVNSSWYSYSYSLIPILPIGVSFDSSATIVFLTFTNESDYQNCKDKIQSFVYDPSLDDTYGRDICVYFPWSDLEKAVGALQNDYATTCDIDITLNPGFSVGDDGAIAYSPSIGLSVPGEIDSETTLEAVKEKPSYRDIDMNLLFPFKQNFKLYDQCKLLLTHIFNYNDVVSPPNFQFYFDSNKDGVNEVYNLLDLSFLETSLNNSNMVDKSWWAIEIKVIDLIRYLIALVLYGLFVMRLIKRLPSFYGSGPWASL